MSVNLVGQLRLSQSWRRRTATFPKTNDFFLTVKWQTEGVKTLQWHEADSNCIWGYFRVAYWVANLPSVLSAASPNVLTPLFLEVLMNRKAQTSASFGLLLINLGAFKWIFIVHCLKASQRAGADRSFFRTHSVSVHVVAWPYSVSTINISFGFHTQIIDFYSITWNWTIIKEVPEIQITGQKITGTSTTLGSQPHMAACLSILSESCALHYWLTTWPVLCH